MYNAHITANSLPQIHVRRPAEQQDRPSAISRGAANTSVRSCSLPPSFCHSCCLCRSYCRCRCFYSHLHGMNERGNTAWLYSTTPFCALTRSTFIPLPPSQRNNPELPPSRYAQFYLSPQSNSSSSGGGTSHNTTTHT